jgi:arginine decarboxylase
VEFYRKEMTKIHQKTVQVSEFRERNNFLIGCRIPHDYFVTKGVGESDITIHAGSYHLALKNAGIEMYNIMTYSSIMPKIANEIKKPDPSAIIHGSVMECIMAVAHSQKGKKATAGIIYGWLYDKVTGEKFGGLVCEHNGDYSLEEINKKLNASISELYYNGFSEKYDLRDIRVITDTISPEKRYGTALVSICFTNYVYPVINEQF